MRALRHAGLLVVAGMFATASAKETPVAPDPKAAEIIKEMGLAEAPTALREGKGWKPPRKIVLTGMGSLDELKAAAPGVEFVVVNSTEEMVRHAGDADAIGSGDNVVCDSRVLAAAKKLRWVAVYSAGVEECLGKAEVKKSGVVVTNMRAIAGPVMAEHSIALMYALSRSLQVSIGRQARGDGWGGGFRRLATSVDDRQNPAGRRTGRHWPRSGRTRSCAGHESDRHSQQLARRSFVRELRGIGR